LFEKGADKLNLPAAPAIKFSFNVPNFFTSTRICLAVAVACLLSLGTKTEILIAGILLIVAASTDFFDGFLARRLGQTSLFGSLFDIVADQILFMPSLILSITSGLFHRVDGLFILNPYLYAVPALTGGVAVLAGVAIFLLKSRKRAMEFPTPTGIAKVNYWFWLTPLILAVLNIGPDILLAILMYLAVISTAMTFYSYLKKGSYVFTD
jgi:phosphatidylglycerophosphate synthase